MNIRTTGIIIRREYLNKVRKKSFLVTTFLVPVLMAALCIVPIVVMLNTKDEAKNIAVVDRSGVVMPMLEDSETLHYVDLSLLDIDTVKSCMEEMNMDAVLGISPVNPEDNSVTADISSFKPLGMEAVENINNKINSAVEAYRISRYQEASPGVDIEGILKGVKADVKLKTYTIDENGDETISETGVYAVLSMVLGLLIFLFITLFGSMVMSAVIEEKASRVVEVLISSVKATELMFGKIIGIALVAITQFTLWILLTFALVSFAGNVLGEDLMNGLSSGAQVTQMVGTADVTLSVPEVDGDLTVVLTTLKSLPYAKIITVFIIFFVFGYLLYASMFAAIGSAVENEGDTQQLQMPLMIPLMIAYFIAIYSFNAPDSSFAFWGSMIPFTSPIVMLARLPFGVPDSQLLISILVLVATTVIFAWISAKIYKVGILVFGKKSTWKDILKWLRQD